MRLRRGLPLAAALLAFFGAEEGSWAEPDPCSPEADVSPCFDADALWIPTHATHFTTLRAARPLAPFDSSLLLGAGLALEPVVLAVPSPTLEGREVHVVRSTTTLTLGVGFGLAEGFGVTTELPLVPHQSGTGVEGVTSQNAPPLGSAAVRDPRFGIEWTALGRRASEPIALAARVELVPPFGDETLLAGARSVTFAPGLAFQADSGPIALGIDASLRLRSAVDFGSVRKGSEAALGVGASAELWPQVALRFGVEAWVRPGLAGAPPGTNSDVHDLPAEWLVSTSLALDRERAWCLALAGGAGLPISTAPSPQGGTEWHAGVTAPAFRTMLALRFARQSSE